MRYLLAAILCCFFLSSWSQTAGKDSLPVKKEVDTLVQSAAKSDSIKKAQALQNFSKAKKQSYGEIIRSNPYLNFNNNKPTLFAQKRQPVGKETIFYLLTGLILFFALIKVLFEKYLQNLFKVFFRASLKQKQIREQLLQTPLPSLLLNIFFVIVIGVFAAFLLKFYHFTTINNFWWLLLYCMAALGILYLGKFLVLKFIGWIFNLSEATDTYIFIVFLINKLLAIALLPLLVLMAFAASKTTIAWVTLAYVAIGFSFLYRYFSSYEPVRREIKVNQLHFFLYLCAFELAPLLLIYKVLINFLERTV